MHWYLIHTKPRQEMCALKNLEQQGYQCYLPVFSMEKLRQGALSVAEEPLFPRYLFIRLGRGDSSQSWAPIRSTKGVSRLVTFGIEPAKVDASLVDLIRDRERLMQDVPAPMFQSGERVCLTRGAFAGVEGIYEMAEGERRVIVLIELLSRSISVSIAPGGLRRAG